MEKDRIHQIQIEIQSLQDAIRMEQYKKDRDPDMLVSARVRLHDKKEELKRVLKAKKSEEKAAEARLVMESVPGRLFSVLKDSRKWLDDFCKKHEVGLSEHGMTYDGVEKKHVEFWSLVLLEHETDVNAFNEARVGSGLPDLPTMRSELLRAAVQLKYVELRRIHLREILKTVEYDPSQDDSELRKWMSLVNRNYNETDVAVYKHWIQNVKRKMMGLTVQNHLFPIGCGSQGAGKTEATKVLIKPVKDFTLQFTVDQLADLTILGAFEDNYVVVCDEMAKADKAEIATLKRIVTNETVDGRPPYAPRPEKLRQNCSFVGLTNAPVKSLIKDEEMRRFYEMPFTARDESEFVEMDNIDAFKIWRCVDHENMNCYFTPFKSLIRLAQIEISTRDPITVWMGDNDLTLSDLNNVEWVLGSSLFNQWCSWMESNGYNYTTNLQAFGDRMHFLGVHSKRVIIRGQKVTVYGVNPKHTVRLESDLEMDIFNANEKSKIF
jgi:hypothetical protein